MSVQDDREPNTRTGIFFLPKLTPYDVAGKLSEAQALIGQFGIDYLDGCTLMNTFCLGCTSNIK